MPARSRSAEDHVIVIFGGRGDLARRKLLPALFHLHHEGLLPKRFRIVGVARTETSDEEFRDFAREAVEEFDRRPADSDWQAFAERLSYLSHDVAPGDAQPLTDAVKRAEAELADEGAGSVRRLFYLAVPPAVFGRLTLALGEADLVERSRVVYEKPFGMDRPSFCELDEVVRSVLAAPQIYTIDHFLGKETLQNVLALRFANGMFEPVWNRAHIDHVQIDVPEQLGVGSRAGFYEQTGALRDMVVTHLFQVLSVIALEPPASLEPKPLTDEKVKVFEAMAPLRGEHVVRGQYEGYASAEGVSEGSDTETFLAARVEVDNWRWAGVPFYLRTGKRLAASRQTVTLAFREPPRRMFGGELIADRQPNDYLTLDLGRGELAVSFLAKRPGPGMDVEPAQMRYSYSEAANGKLVDAYERLLHDALIGDRTLFTRADGIERTWELVQDLIDRPPPLGAYEQGSWGPERAADLIAPRRWYLPERDGRPAS
ncbi:MAG TPA: glucose-6-phosphate dehydrogenase [Egibacteraceae bacterium]|nr:glucose-6-phosphate dehydrogenase [Egibacteraceae bacterium]